MKRKAKINTKLNTYLLFLLLISAFIGAAFLKFDIGVFTVFPFRIILIIFYLLFFMNIVANKGKIKIGHIKVKKYLQFLFIWLLYSVLSISWSKHLFRNIEYTIFLLIGISIIFFIVFYFRSLDQLGKFYNLWLIMLGGMLVLGFWNNLTGNHLVVSKLKNAADRVRFLPTAVFHNRNDFAMYLSLSIPFVYTFIRYSKSKTKSICGFSLLFGTIYLLIITGSRASIIASIIGFLFYIIFILKRGKKLKIVFIFFIVFSLLLIIFPQITQNLINDLESQFISIKEGLRESGSSINVRINLIRNSLKFLLDSYGFGVGAGNVEYHMEHFSVYDTAGIINAHNWWIEIVTNFGVLIFLGYIMFYLGIVINLFKIYYNTIFRKEKIICESLIIGIISFFFASVSSSTIISLRIHWVFLAFALSFINYFRIRNSIQKGEMV